MASSVCIIKDLVDNKIKIYEVRITVQMQINKEWIICIRELKNEKRNLLNIEKVLFKSCLACHMTNVSMLFILKSKAVFMACYNIDKGLGRRNKIIELHIKKLQSCNMIFHGHLHTISFPFMFFTVAAGKTIEQKYRIFKLWIIGLMHNFTKWQV